MPIDVKVRSNGNWAFIQLRRSVNFLLCYEHGKWEAHGGSAPMREEQGGSMLYQAKICLYEAMRGEDDLYLWFDEKRFEDGCPPQPMQFFEWRWTCIEDVKSTIREVLIRIDRPLTKNLNQLLKVRQEPDQGAEKALKGMRVALEIEGNALHRGSTDPSETHDFLLDLIWLLSVAYLNGRHLDGVLNHGVLTEILKMMAKGRGMKVDKAKRIWMEAKPNLDKQVVKFGDLARVILRTDGEKVRFEII